MQDNFSSSVAEAIKKLTPRERPEETPEVAPGYVEYEFVNTEAGMDLFPTSFRSLPRVGDMIESETGRRLRVYHVIHKPRNRIGIAIGKDTGGQHEVTGGARETEP